MRQHYVPRAYLKYFSEKRNNEFAIWVYDKSSGRHFQTNIKNVAVEKDLYELKNIDENHVIENKNAWEEYYSKEVEPELSVLIGNIILKYNNNVISDRGIVFDEKTKFRLSLQIVYQMYRGKIAFDEAEIKKKDLCNEIRRQAEELAVEMYGENHNIDIDSYVDNENLWKLSIAEAAISGESHEGLINRLMNRIWVLYKITDDSQFITSDNPVLLHNVVDGRVGMFQAGLGLDSTILYYPISPKYLMAMYSNKFMLGSMGEFNNQIVILKSKDNDFINNINQLQKQQCVRQVYSLNKFGL